ncbi:3-phosphoshikimate 1-carboxyvinyltransferase [Candidatus Methanoprimaticola sp. MG2]|uniref:3-phosphoshikimate 1-carboxyvinyltransferase n=1 Tax=Candidatus Methanoprimaticola sp. MG2 TaxID=3228838 RepID=UPI0039C74E5D
MTTISFQGGRIEGTISPPPSKSHTHRALFLASMAKGRSIVTNCLLSADTLATMSACRAMGAGISLDGNVATVDGGELRAPADPVDAANSGTTMRILTGICSLFDDPVTITGDESLKKRPMGPLLDSLEACGVECRSNGGLPPVTVKGPNRGGHMLIDGSVSSQFVTSLLLTSPMLPSGSKIEIGGNLVSAPYLDVTTHMMGLFGANASREGNVFTVSGTGYKAYDYSVPADYSSAAFPLVAGALGGRCTVTGMDPADPQGDKVILDILRQAGADVTVEGISAKVEGRTLKACDIDMGSVPDLFPIVTVLLCTAEGDSRLYGAPQLRFKESDRIETTVRMINALGGNVEGTDDGCIIHGVRRLRGGHVEHHGDHRIMMSAAVASILCEGPVTMDDPECASVSFPGFPEAMRTIGLLSEVQRCTRSAPR